MPKKGRVQNVCLTMGCRYALKCIAEQRGEALPKLFQDDGWRLLHHDVMSVPPLQSQQISSSSAIVHYCPSSMNHTLAPPTSQVHLKLWQPSPAPLRIWQVARALVTTPCMSHFCIVLLSRRRADVCFCSTRPCSFRRFWSWLHHQG